MGHVVFAWTLSRYTKGAAVISMLFLSTTTESQLAGLPPLQTITRRPHNIEKIITPCHLSSARMCRREERVYHLKPKDMNDAAFVWAIGHRRDVIDLYQNHHSEVLNRIERADHIATELGVLHPCLQRLYSDHLEELYNENPWLHGMTNPDQRGWYRLYVNPL